VPAFSQRSKDRLATCHPDLLVIFAEVVRTWDCTIIEGARTREQQAEYVRAGKSKTMHSKHLPQADGLSHAVDVAPYPIDWDDSRGFAYFAGYVKAVAERLREQGRIAHDLRWGGDWDGDGNVREHSFFDGPHFELVGE